MALCSLAVHEAWGPDPYPRLPCPACCSWWQDLSAKQWQWPSLPALATHSTDKSHWIPFHFGFPDVTKRQWKVASDFHSRVLRRVQPEKWVRGSLSGVHHWFPIALTQYLSLILPAISSVLRLEISTYFVSLLHSHTKQTLNDSHDEWRSEQGAVLWCTRLNKNLLSTTAASHVSAGSSPGCSISQPAPC